MEKNISPELKIAMQYTGDEELARQMLRDKYNDLFILKAKFDIVGGLAGMLLIKLNYQKETLPDIHGIVTTSNRLGKVRNIEAAAVISTALAKLCNEDKGDMRVFEDICRKIYQHVSSSGAKKDLISMCSKNNAGGVGNILSRIIGPALNMKKIFVELDIEESNSYNVYHKDKYLSKVNKYSGAEKSESSTFSNLNPAIKNFEKGFSKVIETSIPIDPIKGTLMDKLKKGDKYYVMLPLQSADEIELARQLGGVLEGNKPNKVPVSFERIIVIGGHNGYYIYGRLENGMLSRSFEENPIKVCLVQEKSKEAEAVPKVVRVYDDEEDASTKPPGFVDMLKQYQSALILGLLGIVGFALLIILIVL